MKTLIILKYLARSSFDFIQIRRKLWRM